MLKGPYIICVGILISILRFYIEREASPEIVTFTMAIINVIALNYVCLDIINDIYKRVDTLLAGSFLPSNQKRHLIKKAKMVMNGIGWILFLVLSLLYVSKFYNSTWNDILSIVALVISISAEEITEYFGEKIYKML